MCERTLGYIDGNQHNTEIIKNAFTLIRAPEGAEEMKNIRRRDNGTYEGRLVIDGKRHSVYASTQADCLKKLKELKKSPIILQKSESFYSFSKKWLELYKKFSVCEKSYKNYAKIIGNHFSKITKPLNKLSAMDIQAFLNSFPATRIREYIYMTIKQVLKKAYELELIKKDISMFLNKGKIQHGQRNALTLEQQGIILSNIKNSVMFAPILTYLLIGCRPAEISTLELRNENDNFIFIGGTKTQRAKRYVKISPRYKEFFLTQKENILKVNPENIGKKFVKFCQKFNINATLYSLRHTFATNLFYLGVPDKERQVYMGHASAVLTNDVYTDFDPNVKGADVRQLFNDWYPDF